MKFELRSRYLNVSVKRKHEKHHHWIICSDPNQSSEEILALKINKWSTKPGVRDDCLLFPEDIDFIHEKSYINYNDSRLYSLEDLHRMERDEKIREKEKVSKAIMRRIHGGAESTPFLNLDALTLLKKQGFIEGNCWTDEI